MAMGALLAGLLLTAAPAAAVDIQVDLAPGETFQTGWVRVPAGQELHWQMLNGTGYFAWEVESDRYGLLAAGDGGLSPGCALATEDFEARVHVDNTVLTNIHEAHLVLRVTVQNDTGGCQAAPELARQRAEAVAAPGFWASMELIYGVAMVAATGLVAAIAFTSAWRLWRKRPPWGELPPEEQGGRKRPPSRRSP